MACIKLSRAMKLLLVRICGLCMLPALLIANRKKSRKICYTRTIKYYSCWNLETATSDNNNNVDGTIVLTCLIDDTMVIYIHIHQV